MSESLGAEEDPYLWLEDVTGEEALRWVRERNAETVAELAGTARFLELQDSLREVLDADDRIPYVRRRGRYLYNFWQDAANPRGVWRRTTLEEYRTERPAWEIVLDVDALGAAEEENWVWQGATVLWPECRRALVELSRGGADASVVREFDLVDLRFVEDGFELAEAKSNIGWIDDDRIYVGTDFGPGSLTNSGYPRVVKEWRRGTPLSEATTVFEGKPEDVSVHAYHDPTEGFERDFVHRGLDFWRSEKYLRTADGLVRLEVPEDARISAHREWLLITTRTEWGKYPAGALLGVRFDDFLAGERELTVLFEPDEHTALQYHAWTRNHLIMAMLTDVKSRLEVLTPGPDGWIRAPLADVPDMVSAEIIDTDPDESDEYFLDVSGYTQPGTLRRGVIGEDAETVKGAPEFFDSTGVSVRQHFATSADGTRVPYFVVGRETGEPGPTLLTGYGGYEISLTPGYSGTIGRGWLARGGTYAVANIRGGGEYGTRWHTSAMRANRIKVYEDFAAVAADLVERGITTPEQLGIQGGSNGGLLMGVMLTHHPDMFGAIVAQVPLLDMRRFHRMLAGASWMAEYGDPDEPADWAYLRHHSPYHNIHSGRSYPPLLLITSTRDDRVHPAHARKMMARMRESAHDVRYYENIEGGHGAAADNEQIAFKSALVYEFLWRKLDYDR
ncbi:MAG TPA: prolyl oligopeptidase family serine peptidase [Actinophytocola sp.]|uniref:prolyl oligopeptidase family serine peptidase n=1 Tax=Actinophytocola sp. TaxID=1872138 RepID=UPI002DBC3329|nr:prolyl oligopeptidase family serine peptidase [Actinophytocola sp.]HEU5470592.1 prolyl oligopeptidase family serine peptidase [Actinophytocola sp.]